MEPLLLTVEQVLVLLSMSRSTFYRFIEAHKDFPNPIRVGKGVRWRTGDVKAWIKLQSGVDTRGQS